MITIKDYVATVIVRRYKDYERMTFKVFAGSEDHAKKKLAYMVGNAPILTMDVIEVGEHKFDEYVAI